MADTLEAVSYIAFAILRDISLPYDACPYIVIIARMRHDGRLWARPNPASRLKRGPQPVFSAVYLRELHGPVISQMS